MTQTKQFSQEKLLSQYLTTFQRQLLTKQLEIEQTPEYRQRIEIMLLADEGKTQTQICRMLCCSPLTARYWILMAKSGCAHNWQTQPIGRPKTVTSDYRARLKELVAVSPKDLGYPFTRWTGQWLSKHLAQEFKIGVSARHINRLIEEIEAELAVDTQQQPDSSTRSHRSIVADLHDRYISGTSHRLIIADLHDRHTSAK